MQTRLGMILQMIALCHRYKKETRAYPIEWTTIRDPCYLYSQQAQARFMETPELAFLFLWFSQGYLQTEASCEAERFSPADIEQLKLRRAELESTAFTQLRARIFNNPCSEHLELLEAAIKLPQRKEGREIA
jgi:hypothetical protein